ncbi:hypothetical protein R3P38DRAFT_3214722 [Favolaschia claudopus]|uniref:Uncharacterized protein n=1 Tax=Favolaschia claudopus TaxID=2862362 RepID=A0AAW0A9D8_9AGAR
MTSAVPLDTIATSLEDLRDDSVTTRCLCPCDDNSTLRVLEFLWGLDIYALNPMQDSMRDSKSSRLEFNKSMDIKLPDGHRTWTLVPTEETLVAMLDLHRQNCNVPVSERTSLFTEFSASQFEYIFVPLTTQLDFFIRVSGKPQKYTAPYNDFPRVISSANPFFVAFDSRPSIKKYRHFPSEEWRRVFVHLSILWHPSPLPDDFIYSCYPPTLYSVSDHDASDGGSNCASEETAMSPVCEGPFLNPDKEAFVCKWVQEERQQPCDRVIPGDLVPPAYWEERTRSVPEACRKRAQWRVESKRGFQYFERYLPKAAARYKAGSG